MKHTFIIEVYTDSVDAEATQQIQDAVVQQLETHKRELGIRHLAAQWYRSQRGYILSSGEHTSDICGSESPDARYQS